MTICRDTRIAKVVSTRGRQVRINLSPVDTSEACTHCSIAFSCNRSGSDSTVVRALCPPALLSKALPGTSVKAEPVEGAPLRAAVVLFGVPVAAMILSACLGNVLGLDDAGTALLSLAAAALSAAITYIICHLISKPQWRLTEIL